MSVWTDVFQTFRETMNSNTNFASRFDDRFYLYDVPDNYEYPYLYIPIETSVESWMTINDVMSGGEFTVRFTLHSHLIEAGGIKDLDEGMTSLQDEFHLPSSLNFTDYWLISMRRVREGKPYPDPDEDEVFHSFIDFRTRIEEQ